MVLQQTLLTGLATNLYLTALALCLSNRLVETADSSLITAIARASPPEIADPRDIASALATLRLDPDTAALCLAVIELQARARQELEFPSGPHRIFRPTLGSHAALQRLWQSAAENGFLVLSRILAGSAAPALAMERLGASRTKLASAIDGTWMLTADDMAGVLPVWIRRRRHTRYAKSLPVTVWARDRRERGEALDVSQGGALLVLRGQIGRGEKLQIEFRGRGLIAAIVQWTLDSRVGIKFVDPLHPSDPLLQPDRP